MFIIFFNLYNSIYKIRLPILKKNTQGGAYFKKYKAGRKMVYDTGYISWFDYSKTIVIQFFVALMPGALRGWLFKNMLHGKKKS